MFKKLYLILSILSFIITASANTQAQANSRGKEIISLNNNVRNGLKVSADGHYLVDAKTGQPVFILATTAWNINALTYSEIDTLISSTAKNGFNSIMFALDFYPQADEPNAYRQMAYTGPEQTELNPAYFAYCDYIIDKCTDNGLYPMVYTMWSGKTSGIMNRYSPLQLYTMGKKLGARFKKYKNIILVAGGESSPPYIDTLAVNEMGKGLKEGSGGNNLVTVHPTSPHSNSEFYENSAWLDLYFSQAKSNISGINFDLTKAVIKDYALSPIRPVMVVEHRYESGTQEDPVIQRRSLYLSVFAGAFGYAYGHNALWQMTPHTAQKWMLTSWKAGVTDWKQALNTTAQGQLRHIKTLLYAYPYLQRIPDQSLLLSQQKDSIGNRVELMRDGHLNKTDATYIMAYISSPQFIKINTFAIKSTLLNAIWFDPRTAKTEVISQNFKNTGIFQSQIKEAGTDWVIVIEDASKNYSSIRP